MKRRIPMKPVMIVLTVSLVLSACAGCGGDAGSNCQLKLHPIYGSAFGGALLGVIAGDKDGREREYAAIGAGIFAVGALLEQTDKMSEKCREHKDGHKEKQEEEQEVIVQVPNDNGSLTPVVLKKKGGEYIGPNGEHYKRLPTAEQLKPVYGL